MILLSKATLLVIGASGLTGFKLVSIAKDRFNLYGTYNYRNPAFTHCENIQLDVTDADLTRKLIEDLRPDVIVNTSAIHNVDYCEERKEEARKVNVDAVRNLANVASKIGSRLIHISTDFVFDGKKGSYTENDEPAPLSYYALTKLEGEKAAQSAPSYAIVRPSVVYGWTPLETAQSKSSSGKPMNFALWCVTKLSNNEEIKAVTDQYTSPTLADNLAEVMLELAQLRENVLYHVSGLSCLNRYDFVVKLAQTMGFNTSLVKPTTSDQFKQLAPRPKNSCLDCRKIQRELGIKLLTVEESLQIMKEQIAFEAPTLLRKIL